MPLSDIVRARTSLRLRGRPLLSYGSPHLCGSQCLGGYNLLNGLVT